MNYLLLVGLFLYQMHNTGKKILKSKKNYHGIKNHVKTESYVKLVKNIWRAKKTKEKKG